MNYHNIFYTFVLKSIITLSERGRNINTEYTAIVKHQGNWWIGWVEEIPGVNCQEPTREELLESLRATLKEALEFNRQDALSAVGTGYTEEKIAL